LTPLELEAVRVARPRDPSSRSFDATYELSRRLSLCIRILEISEPEILALSNAPFSAVASVQSYLFAGDLSSIPSSYTKGRLGVIRPQYKWTALKYIQQLEDPTGDRRAGLIASLLKALASSHAVGLAHNNLSLRTIVLDSAAWLLIDPLPDLGVAVRNSQVASKALDRTNTRKQATSDPFVVDYREVASIVQSILVGIDEPRRSSVGDSTRFLGARRGSILTDCIMSWRADSAENRVPFLAAYSAMFDDGKYAQAIATALFAQYLPGPAQFGIDDLLFKELMVSTDEHWRFTSRGRVRRAIALFRRLWDNRKVLDSSEQLSWLREARGPDALAVRSLAQAANNALDAAGGATGLTPEHLFSIEEFALLRRGLLASGYRVIKKGSVGEAKMRDLEAVGTIIAVRDHGDWILPEFQYHIRTENFSRFAEVNRVLDRCFDGWMKWAFWSSESPFARRIGATTLEDYIRGEQLPASDDLVRFALDTVGMP
jgi:hypothetical protein